MIVISARELMQNQSKFFELANSQRVIVKKKKHFFQLLDLGDSIPEYNPSPSNDPYFLNIQNIKAIKEAEEQLSNGQVKEYSLGKLKETMGL